MLQVLSGVSADSGVGVGTDVSGAVGVGVRVAVAVAVGAGVLVGVGVAVAVADGVDMATCVAVAVGSGGVVGVGACGLQARTATAKMPIRTRCTVIISSLHQLSSTDLVCGDEGHRSLVGLLLHSLETQSQSQGTGNLHRSSRRRIAVLR